MLSGKTSLGIDISDGRISIALLRQIKAQVKLIKADQCPIPEGAITCGNITEPALLARAIKSLLLRNRIYRRKAVVSLTASPVLSQIFDLPEEMPGNIGQYVRNEIKRSPFLGGKEINFDYCGIGRSAQDGCERIFVGAVDNDKIVNLLKTLSLAKVEPVAIELGIIAVFRALQEKVIADSYQANLLVAFFNGAEITVCVFRKGRLDFIRTVDVGDSMADMQACLEIYQREIETVIQFYEVEVEETAGAKWEFALVGDSESHAIGEIRNRLSKRFGPGKVRLCMSQNISEYVSVSSKHPIEKAGICSLGLAMKPLQDGGKCLGMNLMGVRVAEEKAVRKVALLTANCAAAVLLLMILVSGLIQYKLNRTWHGLKVKNQAEVTESVEELLKKQNLMNAQYASLSAKYEKMCQLVPADCQIDWAIVLDQVRTRTPEAVYITKINSTDGRGMVIEGNSFSFKSIYMFAELLDKDGILKSAEVVETSRNQSEDGLVAYVIKCLVAKNTETKSNAG